jgi:NADPH2:quinone reductase
MKAIRVSAFGGPEVLKLEEVPDLKPGQGEVLVKVKAIGVNPFEAYIRAGMYPIKPALPYTPGVDLAGIVEAVGPGVSRFKAGDRVYSFGSSSGSYAQASLVPESRLQFLPENVSFSQGAAVGVPYGTAYQSLFVRAQAKPGESVLVHGASGGVGLAAVQLARAAGLKVFGTAGSAGAIKVVEANGAHHAFDHHSADYPEKIKALTQGKGVNVILEMLANVNLEKDLGLLDFKGRVVIIGSRGRTEIDPRLTMGKDLAILGMTNSNAQALDSNHAALRAGLENGSLKPVIAMELPLAEASQAQEKVMQNGKIGKIVLIP